MLDYWRYWPWYAFCAIAGVGFIIDVIVKHRGVQAVVAISVWSSVAAGMAVVGHRRSKDPDREFSRRDGWRNVMLFFAGNSALSALLLIASMSTAPASAIIFLVAYSSTASAVALASRKRMKSLASKD